MSNGSEADALAKVCANVIKAQRLGRAEEIETATKILLRVSGQDQVTEPRASNAPTPDEPDPKPKLPKKTVTLAKAGDACSCSSCGQVVYHRVAEIRDPMPIDELIAAFTPKNNASIITRSTPFEYIDDGFFIDCPLCKGDKTVTLFGKGRRQVKEEVPKDTSVGSFGPDELEIE